jgi:L-amino acid N-acyltransferase YncA
MMIFKIAFVGQEMIDYVAYRKFVTLKNRTRIMFRFLSLKDRELLIQLFQEAAEDDIRFLKQDVKDVKLVNYWVEHINFQKVLPLVAVDLDNNRIVADATLHRGKHSTKHIGEVRIFVSRPFRNLGLGSVMLDEIISLAMQMNLQYLKAEIIADQKKVIKAFRSKDFRMVCTFEDFFIRKDGVTHDITLMVRPVIKSEEVEF